MKFRLLLLVLLLVQVFNSTQLFAEITITYPLERTIYQRNNQNTAKVVVSGNFTDNIDRIEVQLRSLQNSGNTSHWITIQQNPVGGYFQGSVEWTGGWYELEVRGWLQDNYVGSAYLSRVGIGEVFIIAGQSNAQGLHGYGASDPDDDRINCVNDFNAAMNYHELSQPRFSKLEANSTIGPRGQSAWYWGQVGKLLCQRYNVPILFYNAAWDGTTSTNWQESTTGNTRSAYIDAWYQDRMPYGNLPAIFNSYLPVTGARGILWHQGESDNIFNVSTDTYFHNIQAVIAKSREDAAHNVSWVVARASYEFSKGISQSIIDGQNRVINSISNVFAGPNTDDIHPRRDGVHFFDQSYAAAAHAWNDALNDHFFSQSQPISALDLPSITAACAGNNQLRLTIHDDVRSVQWNNGIQDRSTVVGGGTYKAKITMPNGRILYTPEIRVPAHVEPATPSIRLEGSNPVCRGNEAVLIADNVMEAYWNNGFVGNRMNVSASGDYQVRIKNIYGCEANSNTIQVSVIDRPLPATPTIQADGNTTFCDGGQVTLKSMTDVQSRWSTGSHDQSLQIRQTGTYMVRALDSEGCYSPYSAPVHVQVNANPSKPHVFYEGATTFCEGGSITLNSSYENSNTWNTNATSRQLTVRASGEFLVTYRDHNGCEATSDAVRIQVNPLPSPPQVTALRPTEFCERDYTILQSNPQHSYRWSTGQTSHEIRIERSGDYTLTTTDFNGCTSFPSSAVRVQVNPLPSTPVITANRSTEICESEFVTLTSTPELRYLWNNGSQARELSINQQGLYFVQTVNNFNCTSDPSNAIAVSTLPIPAIPMLQALGKTDFCDGETLTIQANGEGEIYWNTGDIGESIQVEKSGAFAVRALAQNGCYSFPTDTIQVTVRPVPTKPTIAQIGTFSLESTSSINGGNFSWFQNNQLIGDQNESIIKAKQTGSYTVFQTIQYTDLLSCSSDYSDPYLYQLEENTNGLSVFPNPSFNGYYSLETLEDFSDATISIIDMTGNIVTEMKNINTKQRQSINIGHMKSGTYILKVHYLSKDVTQKIILAL